MLGLQRPPVTEDQVDHVLGEPHVPLKLRRVLEALIEHEVNVAVLRMPEDHAVLVVVLVEELGQGLAGAKQRRHRNDDILQQRRCPRRTRTGHQRVEAFANVPQGCANLRVGGQLHRLGHRKAREQRRPNPPQILKLLRRARLKLNQQRRVR